MNSDPRRAAADLAQRRRQAPSAASAAARAPRASATRGRGRSAGSSSVGTPPANCASQNASSSARVARRLPPRASARNRRVASAVPTRRVAGVSACVERGQFLEKHPVRRPVAEQMMERQHEQMMIGRELTSCARSSGPCSKSNVRALDPRQNVLQPRRSFVTLDVDRSNIGSSTASPAWIDLRLAVGLDRRAQRLVAIHDALATRARSASTSSGPRNSSVVDSL